MLFLLVPLFFVGLTAAVAAVFWKKILNWSEDHLTPWLSAHVPQLVQQVKNAFAEIDEKVVHIRKVAKEAWQRIRQFLLKQTAEFFRQSDGDWAMRIKSWLVDPAGSGSVYVRETEKRVAYDDLPDEVRREYLRHGTTARVFDVTQIRDHEVMTQNA
jgi:hypothetical protein